MAKRKESNRTGWTRNSSSGTSRPNVSRASGSADNSDNRATSDASIKRMGPYETSYQIDFGYRSRDTV